MKKIKNYLVIFFTFVALSCVCISCEDPEPVRPACESEHYGTVIVRNSTGYNLKVDVNSMWETWLVNGSHHRYTYVPSGIFTVWGSYNGSDWAYSDEYLSSCDEFTYTWYAKKSSNGLYLQISKGDQIIKVITDLENKIK